MSLQPQSALPTAPDSPTSTTLTMGTPSPIPTTVFSLTLEPIQNTPTCGSVSIDWTLTTPANVSTVIVGLIVAPFFPSSPPTMLQIANVSINIPSGNDLSTWIYEWIPVNVTQGTYVIQAFLDGGAATSFPFNVTAGDTSCLVSSAVPSVPPASQSPSPTSPARDALQTGHKLGASTITAIVLGTILFAVAVTAFYFLCARRRTSSHSPRSEKGYEGRARRSFPGANGSVEVVRLTPMHVDGTHDTSTFSQQDTVHGDLMGGRTNSIPPQPASNVMNYTTTFHYSPKEGLDPSDVMTERMHRPRDEQRISSFLHLTDSTNTSMISDSM